MNDWQTYHNFRILVRRNLAYPLLHQCGDEYTVYVDKDVEQFKLKCLACDVVYIPGESGMKSIRAIVKEHFVD